ncbi:hypothetical protein GQR58_030512 [Nymphon striatum]|nr:hypothetical protein GQR58_030512 [Nymphon striatum]
MSLGEAPNCRRAQARCSVVQTATEVWRMARGPRRAGAGPRCQLRSASHEASRSGVAMSQPVVLVTSASGRIGKELVARLAQAGDFTVRACSFTASKADELRALGADEVVPFDLNDASTWDAALDGVSAVYSASLDPMLEGHLAFSAALGERRDQIKHVVRISCMGADTNTASYDADKHCVSQGCVDPAHAPALLVG